jgi:hypothetical protein
MKEHGYDDTLIAKLCHGNWLRVWNDLGRLRRAAPKTGQQQEGRTEHERTETHPDGRGAGPGGGDHHPAGAAETPPNMLVIANRIDDITTIDPAQASNSRAPT